MKKKDYYYYYVYCYYYLLTRWHYFSVHLLIFGCIAWIAGLMNFEIGFDWMLPLRRSF